MVGIKKRILWIDFLKIFAILMVVWGHVLPRMGWYTGDTNYTGAHGFIYSFHMPLFMMLSGFVSYKIIDGKLDVIRKFRQLIIPCITLFLICSVVGFDENFWYLKSLFLCYFLWGTYFTLNCKYKKYIALLACLIIFPIIWCIPILGYCKLDFMLPFFGFGLFLHSKSDYLKKNLNKLLPIMALCFIVCEIFWNKDYIWYNSQPCWIDYKEMALNLNIVIHPASFWYVGFRYLTGAVASLFFILFSMKCYEALKPAKIMLKIANGGGIPCMCTSYKPLS